MNPDIKLGGPSAEAALAARIALSIGEISALVLIAPATALGILRTALSAAAWRAVRADLDRDYVKMPLHGIERHLRNLS